MTDKDGKIINEPQGFLNHAMDSGRYGMESLKPLDVLDELPHEELFDADTGLY